MLHGRWCPQTFAGVWHRARPQQRPEPDDGGAPASEACDTWVNVQGPLLHVFFLPQVMNQHATVLNHVELQRLGEAKRSQGASRKTRKTRRVSGHCSLGSIPHLKLSFLFGFLWFLAVSLAVFFLLTWLFGVVFQAPFRNFMRRASFMFLLSSPLSLRLLFVKRAQSTACSASSSCQSRRIAGTFDPRASQDMGRQP